MVAAIAGALAVAAGIYLSGSHRASSPAPRSSAAGSSGHRGGAVAVRAGSPSRSRKSLFCRLAPGETSLPPGRLRGLAHHLRQNPDVALATAAQQAAAERLLSSLRTVAARWSDPRRASAAGFDLRTARRAAGDRTAHYLHAGSERFSHDGQYLDPQRPEALIYANVPGRPLALIGVMFSMPRGIHGPTPGGSITRWHFHRVCARGNLRGLQPLPDGSCPSGQALREGSEMMHVWFTPDLRSAYAVHAPERDLCAARLLPVGYCASGQRLHGM